MTINKMRAVHPGEILAEEFISNCEDPEAIVLQVILNRLLPLKLTPVLAGVVLRP